MAKDKYKNSYDEEWSNGPRERKDKPGKKHNNTQHSFDPTTEKKKPVKTPQKFRRHSDDSEDD